ncbi:Gfo/Idh/MocA family protein [Actinomadura madurae]|uniref:Gfo/Idh/MocA family protein n=2 Tax=Actinomadura madurae TaxID=1993 RepID=UPI002026355A|nr:Gfo/Idh/MocA family oxidoreductase [Actinomadura madurae]MCP9964803.1 Gfo/Idh/MocA family oxidoreductase [Actinomadura madurae]MCQ0011206.1 Gfo/Idh/MocA family oxidoreductase [Actinomadura madurae]URM93700.1 Gfo/Idh/MocA family oxidoreductase [Actinomadura madurae]URN04424.1 Gfo/Idh/MocA family oxidoreductase [Actinomadura madurae]
MSDSVAVGLVGAGPWAGMVHAPALAAGPATRLAGVWARRPEASAELAGKYGAPSFARIEELFDACEAVAFSVPPDVQAGLAAQAARAGKAVLLEKPLAMDLDGARRVAGAIAEAGVVSQMVFTLRYSRAARAFLARAAELEPFGGYGSFVSSVLSGGPFATPWRLEKGALLDLGPHIVDLLDASLGRVAGVRAHGDPLGWVGLTLEHEGGAVSQASVSMAGHGELPPARVEVYGRNGHAQLDWSQLGDDAFATMVAEFAAAVRGGPSPLLDAAHGLRIQEVLAAAEAQLAD